MTLSLRFTAVSDVGRVRKDNQDSGYAGPHLLVVADGVGGAARGDIASSACVDAIRKLDVPAGNDALSEIAATLHLAHDRLAEIVESHPELDGTSTTVTAAVFDGTHLRIGHVGDSRAYLLREGTLEQLTSDHTLVQSLVDEGRITEDEARVHPHRNLILRAVDGVHEPEPDLMSVPVQPGDRVLFCSDGCSGVIDDVRMAALLGDGDLPTVASTLVSASLEAGSSDNVTVVVAEVVDAEPDDARPVTVGAAVASPHLRIADEATGNLSDEDVSALAGADDGSSVLDPEDIRYAPLPPPRRPWARRLLALLVVLALLGGAGYGAYRYSQTRYYVAEDAGVVSIFKGVDFDVPGLKMHTLVRHTSLTLKDIGTYGDAVRDGVDFGSLRDAETYVRRAGCPDSTPRATATEPAPDPTSVLDDLGLMRVYSAPPAPTKRHVSVTDVPFPRWTGTLTPPTDCAGTPQ
ncbi:MAG: PP2C family protein-serine/threonine phosphatase [Marmoricola sp.]